MKNFKTLVRLYFFRCTYVISIDEIKKIMNTVPTSVFCTCTQWKHNNFLLHFPFIYSVGVKTHPTLISHSIQTMNNNTFFCSKFMRIVTIMRTNKQISDGTLIFVSKQKTHFIFRFRKSNLIRHLLFVRYWVAQVVQVSQGFRRCSITTT